MRCDVNLSVRKKGEDELRTRTEIKNIGSFSGVARAVELEADRQCGLYENGGIVMMETLRYDENADNLKVMRVKETADDYRFFPEPDIPAFKVDEAFVNDMRENLPELPDDKKKRYETELLLSKEVVSQMIRYRNVCAYFEDAMRLGASPRNSANLIIGALFAALKTDSEREGFRVKVSAENFAELTMLLDQKKINMQTAQKTLNLMNESGKNVKEFISESDLSCLSPEELQKICADAVRENPKAADDVRSGKEKAMNVLVGAVMKASRGKADSAEALKLIKNMI